MTVFFGKADINLLLNHCPSCLCTTKTANGPRPGEIRLSAPMMLGLDPLCIVGAFVSDRPAT